MMRQNFHTGHSLAALCWHGLGRYTDTVPESIRKKWADKLYTFIRKNALMSNVSNQLYDFCEDKALYEYYKDPFGHLVPDPKSKYGYAFTENDFYIHITAHSYKHYMPGGTGLRNLVDCYVYRHSCELDRAYLDSELSKTGIADYERKYATLSEKLFSDNFTSEDALGRLSEKELEELNYYIQSGTYGTLDNLLTNEMRSISPDGEKITLSTRLRYLRRLIIPDRRFMEVWCYDKAPFFLRHKFLFVFSFPWRFFTVCLKNISVLKIIFGKKK